MLETPRDSGTEYQPNDLPRPGSDRLRRGYGLAIDGSVTVRPATVEDAEAIAEAHMANRPFSEIPTAWADSHYVAPDNATMRAKTPSGD